MEEKKERNCLSCKNCIPPCELVMIFTWFLKDLAEAMRIGKENAWSNLDELNHRITKSIKENQELADNAVALGTLRFSVTKLQPCEENCVWPISILIEKGTLELEDNSVSFTQKSRIEALFDPS
jgi:hypothetical protein